MKKRILSMALTVCMVLSLLPTMTIPAAAAGAIVRDEANLKLALANSSMDEIILSGSIALTGTLTVSRDVTLSLGGFTLTGAAGADAANGTTGDAGAGGTVITVAAGTLTVLGAGSIVGGQGGIANNAYSGGAGGNGITLTGGSLIVKDGASVSGGQGGIAMGTASFSGGAGGDGINATGGSLTVTSATIKGGWGGSANGTSIGSAGTAGKGGNGIYTKNIGAFTVTNSVINGGTGGGVGSANRSLLAGGEGLRLLENSPVTLSGSCTVTGGTGGIGNSKSGQGAHAINSAKIVTIDTGSNGNTTITGGNGAGIGVHGSAIVTGSGTATITGGNGGQYDNYHPGWGIYENLTVDSTATVYASGGYGDSTFKPGVIGAITAASSLIQDSDDNKTYTTLTGTTSAKRYVRVLPLYDITAATTTNGSYTVNADGAAVTKAAPGQTVSISDTPSTGFELSAITVTKTGDTNTAITVKDKAFTMPNYPVSVTVTFARKGYEVSGTVSAGTSGASVSGITVNLYEKTDTTFQTSFGSGTTDSNGAYKISGKAPNGDYVVRVVASSGNYAESTADVTIADAAVTAANITLAALTTKSIALKSTNHKTAYIVGDTLDVSNLTITVTRSDDSTYDKAVTAGMVSDFDSTAAVASQTLTITLDGKTTCYAISISKKTPTLTDFTYSTAAVDYTGQPRPISVTAKAEMGNVTVAYTGKSGTNYAKSETAPTLPGTYAVEISVAGNDNYNAATLGAGDYTINKANPTVTLASSKLASTYEDEVTFTATVAFTGGAVPTGKVTFQDGNADLATVTLDSNGVATLKKSDLTAATHPITAVYSGDGNYNEKTSSAVSQGVVKRAMVFTIAGTEQTYESGVAKTITLDKTGSKLTADAFNIQYYRVDENEGVLASTTPVSKTVAAGQYLYVISFKNTQTNYEIARTYSVGSTALPASASYDNVGYLLIKVGASDQQKPISFKTGVVNMLTTDTTYQNELTNENGTTPTYASSEKSVATVAGDGTVTILKAGSATITATSTKSGTTPVYASYTLNISKAPVTVTVQDKSVTYGDASPYTDAAQLTFSPAITSDYDATDLTFSGYTVGKGVNTYDISAKGVTSEKYVFTYVPGTLTVTQKELGVDDLTFAANPKVYDAATTATGSVTVKSTALVGSDTLGVGFTVKFADANVGNSKQVDFTNLSLTGGKADNYKLTTATGTATASITPAAVTVVCQNSTVAYDGNVKTVAVSAYVDGKLFTNYDVTYNGLTAAPRDVGEYTVGIALKDAVNYTVTPFTAKLTISSAAQDSFEIVGVPDTVTYGDGNFTLSAQGNTTGSTVTYAVTGGDAVSISDSTVTIVKPGTVTITATSKLDGYKDKTRTITFTVKKKPVVVTADNQAMVYGEPFSSVANVYTTAGTVIGNDVAGEASYTTTYTPSKGAGSYLITPSGLTSDYYTLTYEPGTLTVNPKTLTEDDFTVTVANKEYDGTTAADFTVAVATVEGDQLTAVYTGSFTDKIVADSAAAKCIITGVGGSKADSYVLSPTTIEKTAHAEIAPMPITFTFGTHTYLYDGQQKAVMVSAVDSKNRVFSDFTVKYDGKSEIPRDVGTYTVTAELSDGQSYTVNGENTAELTITEGNVVVWAAAGTTQKYDGNPKAVTPMSVPAVQTAVTYYAITEDGAVDDVISEPTAVGKYLYVITQSDPNYKIGNEVTVAAGDMVAELTGSNFGVMEIAENVQTQPVFAATVVNKTYGDDSFANDIVAQEPDATITYASSDEQVATVEGDGQITILKPGTTIITATSTKEGYGDVSTRFAVQVAKKTVTLKLDEKTIVTYKGLNWVVPYTVTGDVAGNTLEVSGITFTYTDQSDYTKHTPKNVGTYLASAHVSTDNAYYTSTETTGFLQIDPAPIDVTAEDKTVTYGDAAPGYTVRYTLLGDDAVNGVSLDGTAEFDCVYKQFDDVGSYPITPSGLHSPNYSISFIGGTLTVNPKPVALTWNAPLLLPYSSAEQSITAAVSNAANSDVVTVTAYTGNTGKDKGSYTAEATALSNANYTLTGGSALTQAWEITAAAPALTLSNQSTANTGKAVEISAAHIRGVGADGDISASYTVRYTYYTDASCTQPTTAAHGAAANGGAPSENGTYYVKASIPAMGNYAAAETTAQLTIYTPSHSGGGGSVAITTPDVTLPEVIGGTVTLQPAKPAKGDKVTVTVVPDSGFTDGGVTVTDKDGKPISVTKNADGTYSFTMPGDAVTVTPKFNKETRENPFGDVPNDAYYRDAVLWAVAHGVTGGTADGIFAPHTISTRAQTITFLWRAMGSPEPTATVNPFADVSRDAYYCKAVLWAVEKGITEGTSETAFSPDETVTRSQTVTFLYRAAGKPAVSTDNPFGDVADDTYYANAVLWAVAQKITGGTETDAFSPAAGCTRAQIVTFLYRYLGQ